MNKNLPNVYAVPITKKIENNKETYKSFKKEENIRSAKVTMEDINKIFNSKTHVYKTKVNLVTTRGEKEVYVVGIVHESLLTLDGETIKFEDILSIKKV